MNIYLAASYPKRFEMRKIRSKLQAAGARVISSWIDTNPQQEEFFTMEESIKFADRNIQDLQDSNCMIIFPEESTTGGLHVELGIAFKIGIMIIMIGKPINIYHFSSQIKHIENIEETIKYLKSRGMCYLSTQP